MIRNQVDIVTMGCSKNLVDSERLMHQLELAGYRCTHDSKRPCGEIAVINTCGFIGDAKEESIQTILEFAERKEQGKLDRLYVMGCLSERYMKDLQHEIPQVDKYYGKFDFPQLLADLGHSELATCEGARHLTTPRHYAYLKISEGCDRHCAYCAIPIITGRHVSRKKEDILQEVRQLTDQGVKELQVIAQELTYYGMDIDGHRHIADLVDAIADIPGVEWIRLHYAYPHQFPTDLLDVMRERSNVCKYLDIALQHISDPMLSAMHRHVTKADTIRLIREIRERVPGICLRTTLMTGFPGETEDDFDQLMDFVRETRFERMGTFAYSEEEGTWSARHLKDNVPEETKRRRLDKLMALQQEISAQQQAAEVGKTLPVMIDRKEGEWYVGRTEYSSPEVDPEVLIPADRRIATGHIRKVRITGAEEFDLYGQII